MGKRDYRQSGHINSSWSGAVSLPVLRWYHAASSQSPPIAPTRHYIRIPSIGPCVREQSGRNSCSTRSSIVSKMLFLRDDLSSSRFRHFDSPFRAFEDRGKRIRATCVRQFRSFFLFFVLLLLRPFYNSFQNDIRAQIFRQILSLRFFRTKFIFCVFINNLWISNSSQLDLGF